ncbi:MAG: AraC family transcriptional regulator [Angelakisella sp.]|nr:AraC family transcriptional regulator [Angelakisella sp.]
MSNNRYEASPTSRTLGAAHLLYVSTSAYGGDWHSTLHTHAHAEIFYCVRGLGRFNVQGRLLPMETDDIIIINPNVEHTELSQGDNPFEYIVLGVKNLEFSAGKGNTSPFTMLNFKEDRSSVLFYLQEMRQEIANKAPNNEAICKNLLDIFLMKLQRQSAFEVTVTPTRRASKECVKVKRYIDENYFESIDLDFLAEFAHINKFYLVHSFTKEYGTSPISYLIERRIRESKYHLSNTNHSLSQISNLLGFSSQSYFSQSFKKLEGMSPNEYRKQSRKEKES